jgi:chromosome segregation protein
MLERSQADLHAAHTQLDQAEQTLAALPALDTLTQAAQSARQELEAAREAVAATEHMATTLHAERHQAESALELAGQELAAWQARRDDAAARIQGLQARRDAARAAHHAIGDAPAELAARAARSGAALASAEAAHGAAQAKLQAADRRVRALALAQRDAEQALASCRESLVRGEAAREAAAGALAAVLARAAERLGTEHALPAQEDISDAAEERARKKFERLAREREEMGPVNLRAELELEELDQRLATLDREREELGTAIAKLRGAIGHLNREGRTRLEAVFTQVDQHFRTLFTRMMGGGRAHLALTGSEDPLQAGLEIYAEPPGKKLAALSLLSGGEQALTALSLIFAVFRCTPSPISVLDEVDAPLDDANVERFCTLLDDVVRDTGTRFLVVTHHQLTMSRMDRLFGVTMQERGVSRLLSVDFQRAMEMVELKAAE